MKVYVLSGMTSDESTTVLGVYSTPEAMIKALTDWNSTKTKLRHYFYDSVEIDSPAVWTNEQSAIYPV